MVTPGDTKGNDGSSGDEDSHSNSLKKMAGEHENRTHLSRPKPGNSGFEGLDKKKSSSS